MNTELAQQMSLEFIALQTRVDEYEDLHAVLNSLLSTTTLVEAVRRVRDLKEEVEKLQSQLAGVCARLHGQGLNDSQSS